MLEFVMKLINIWPYFIRWVVTGAHCIDEDGKYSVATEIDVGGRFKNKHSISRRVIHPAYRPVSDYKGPVYDIGSYTRRIVEINRLSVFFLLLIRSS